MLGKGSIFLNECINSHFIGVDFGINQDLTHKLPDEWRAFNRAFIPVYLESHPEKTRVAAGLACGAVWTVSKGIREGDMVLSPDGLGNYHVCEVTGPYNYQPGEILPHRRPVQWLQKTISKANMSEPLQMALRYTGTVNDLSKFAEEINRLMSGITPPGIIGTDDSIEDPSAFAMEKHLEDFLVANWSKTILGREFSIFEEEGEQAGQQYQTDTGPIDILAISKDKRTLLVLELKKGRATDVVVGQILRYMGYVKEELAEPNQQVKGAIIAMEDDTRLRRALSVVPNIDFYRYEVSFKLKKE